MNPKLSIIMPVYNVEEYLGESIESILQQTFKDFELILINDGSTDNSGEICEKYSKLDNRIRVMHKENSGAGSARNYGIMNSTGEFLAFVDSDDTIECNMYKTMIDIALKEESDIVVCGYKEIDYLMNNEKINTTPLGNDNEIESDEIKEKVEEFLKKNQILGYASLFNKIYKREVIIRNNLFLNEDMKFAEDLSFNISVLMKIKKINAINEPFYNCRRINSNSIMNSSPNLHQIFQSREIMLQIISSSGITSEVYRYCLGYENAITVISYIGMIKSELASKSSLILIVKRLKSLLRERYLINALKYYDGNVMTLKTKMIAKLLRICIK